ncbi:hypothetical protein [Metabacillus fastidiosus]|uniref:hypothetical protein n=1 Tax=Metabacillus fastidiosus TaxID=1458 RepID=UPI003D2968EE
MKNKRHVEDVVFYANGQEKIAVGQTFQVTNVQQYEQDQIEVTARKKADVDIEAMAAGYMWMGNINTNIANEEIYAENEAEISIENLLK